MRYKITHAPKRLHGTINLPASKSISNRLVIINALCAEHITVGNLSRSGDTQIIEQLIVSDSETLDVGQAGAAMRFLTAYFSIKQGVTKILTGSDRMKERPIGILVEALRKLGAEIDFLEREGYPPLRITGKQLNGCEISVTGNVSSQFITGLLLTAPTLANGLIINIEGKITSMPYINMTLSMMNYFGVTARLENSIITVNHGIYAAMPYDVEPDWSSASYWYSMAALSQEADIFLPGLKEFSIQGDSVVASIFTLFGVHTEFSEKGVRITKQGKPATEFGYDFTDCPDLAQTVITTSAALRIPGVFTGLESLRIKETDRVTALKNELKKMGTQLKEISYGRVKLIPGTELIGSNLPGLLFQTYQDHRMALSFTPLSILYGDIIISDPEVVEKSYPHFWQDLKSVGFIVEKKYD